MRRSFRILALGLALEGGCGDGDEGATAAGASPAENASRIDASSAVFDESLFATFRLTMAEADWAAIVQTPDDDTWRRATMEWQGEIVADVGVRPSGVTTRIAGNPKPSIRIDFNTFVPGRQWRSLGQVRFDAFVRDESLLRDRLSYWLYRQAGLAAPRASHAQLVVNGDLKGVYGVEEPIRKQFVRRAWGDDGGILYETIHALDPYAWTGPETSNYVPFPFEPKTGIGTHAELVTLIDVLNHAPMAERRARLAAGILDLDAFLRFLAVLQLLADYDGLTASWGANNHYWYVTGAQRRLVVIPWDPEFSLGLFGMSPERGLDAGFSQTVACAWLLSDAEGRALFKAKVSEVLEGPFQQLAGRIDPIREQIREAVRADPYKHKTWEAFEASGPAMKDWLQRRILSARVQLLN